MPGPEAAAKALLHCHPATPQGAVRVLSASITRPEPAVLALEFALAADAQWLAIPPPVTPGFVSGLWRHTCFEVFLAADPADGYLEYNLAPSGEWAAFAFTRYRAGMRPLPTARRPAITWSAQPTRASLSAVIDLDGLPVADPGGDWRVGLSAVVEDLGGGLSYWALAHPTEKPDFHLAEAFVLTIAPPALPRHSK